MKNSKLKASLLLVLTAAIWGAAFVAQSSGMEYIGPYTFNAIRCLLGSFVLLPLIIKSSKKEGNIPFNKTTIIGGICCGISLFLASSFQQIGMLYTSPGKAGFITALYSVLVPIFGLFIGHKTQLKVWLSAGISLLGLYFLCVTEGFTIATGDLLVLVCAIMFAFQILFINHYSPIVDGIKLSFLQMLITSVLSAIVMFFTEKPVLNDIAQCWLPLSYAGFLSMGVAYTLQIVAQKDADPTVASLIMSLESVFAVIFSAILIGEKMNLREISGCVLIFSAVILSQLPEIKKRKEHRKNEI